MCFPSNEKDPCTDSGSLSGTQVPAVSHGLRKKKITTISSTSSYTLNIFRKIGKKKGWDNIIEQRLCNISEATACNYKLSCKVQ